MITCDFAPRIARVRIGALLSTVEAPAWLLAVPGMAWVRLTLDCEAVLWREAFGLAIIAALLQIALSVLVRRHHGQSLLGSVDDVVASGLMVSAVALALFVINALLSPAPVPRSTPLLGGLLTMAIAMSARLIVRRSQERARRPDPASAQRTIVFGAGAAGAQVIRSLRSSPDSGYLPVAVVDDDPRLRRHLVEGVPIAGPHQELARVAQLRGATTVIVAIKDVDPAVMRELARDAVRVGLAVKVLPPMRELVRSWVGFSDLRALDIHDLLGRQPVHIDVPAVSGFLAGRRVLVTGAGGSIGSELCRQVHGVGPSELMMLDRDESALHAVQLSIYGSALLNTPDVILADIRDQATIHEIFLRRRPEVVFHAAALKHLPMLEQYPAEAWKSNVLGTVNVLRASEAAEVSSFVNISTDKAANPTSVLGYSKRLGERLVAETAARAAGTYVSVRFGNVLGSRGSVLTTFTEQIARGGPITVTDPDVTRYFMTVSEAVQLVMQAGAVGRRGEVLVLDMGKPVRIAEVAAQLVELSGKPVEIVFTGLRPGEKLHEELLGGTETDRRPLHPSISQAPVPELSVHELLLHAERVGVERAMPDLAWPVATPTWRLVAQ